MAIATGGRRGRVKAVSMPGREPIADALRSAIADGGLSLYALATAAGVDVGSLGRFARRECGLKLPAVDRLFAVLGLRMVSGPEGTSDPGPPMPTDAIRAAIVGGVLSAPKLSGLSGVHAQAIRKLVDRRAGLELVSADRLAAALGLRVVRGPRPAPVAKDERRPIFDAIFAEIGVRRLDADELARATGIRKEHLERLLGRRGDVRLATVDRLCEYLGLGFAVGPGMPPTVPSEALRAAISGSGLSARRLMKLSGVVYQSIQGFTGRRTGLDLVSADRIAAALELVTARGPVARPADPPPPEDPSIPYLDGLRAAAKASGLSVYALSRLSGVSQPPISRFLKGESKLNNSSFVKLANAVGFHPASAPVGPSPAAPANIAETLTVEPTDSAHSELKSELAKLSGKRVQVVHVLINADPGGLTGAAIRNASGVSGWWRMLRDLKESSPYWGTRIIFPAGEGKKGGTKYRIKTI